MDINNPLVSIIIPVYNAEKYIAETLRSALAQTWKNKEIIIVNDGSTDRSREVISGFRSDEIILIDQPNQGASAAKQAGFERSRGEYIQYLDADDLLSPNKIEAQLRQLAERPGYLSICGTVHFNDGDDPEKLPVAHEWYERGSDDPADFLIKLYGGSHIGPEFGGMIQPNAFLTPRNLIERSGPWDISISPCADEDGEYFCRVMLASKGIIYAREAVNYYRKFTNGKSLSARKDRRSETNLLRSTDLKAGHLLSHTNDPDAKLALSRLYYENAFNCYPIYIDIALEAEKKAKILAPGFDYKPYKKGLPQILSSLAGWKPVRYIQYFKNKLSYQ